MLVEIKTSGLCPPDEFTRSGADPEDTFPAILGHEGAGVTTGISAVINTATVEIGSTAMVFGLGGIGLDVIQGPCLAGAEQIVGVDLNES